MLPKRTFTFCGVVFLLIGLVILANSFQGITGFSVFSNDSGQLLEGFWAFWFLIGGIVLLLESRGKKEGELEILISHNAMQKAEHDSKISENYGRYQHEVQMIAADPAHRPKQKYGDFYLSPTGQTKQRVAYYIEGNKLHVVDYFTMSDEKGVRKWIAKAKSGEITKQSYKGKYTPLRESEALERAA